MAINFDEHKLPFIDLGNSYQIKLETSEDDVTEADREKARVELREIPENVEQANKELNELLSGEKNFECPLGNLIFNTKFLRPSKFYAEGAFDQIRKYYKFKLKHKKTCDNLIPSSIKHVYEQEIISFLPLRDQHRRRILLVEVGKKWNPSKCSIYDIFRAVQISLEAGMLEPVTQINGVITILDMDGLQLKQIMHFTPSFAAMVLEWIQDCVAIRLKGIYIINNTYLFNMLFAIFKPFIREKLRKRIHFLNKDWKTLGSLVGSESLPDRFGGTLDCPPCPGKLLAELMMYYDKDNEMANRIGYEKTEKWDAILDQTLLYKTYTAQMKNLNLN